MDMGFWENMGILAGFLLALIRIGLLGGHDHGLLGGPHGLLGGTHGHLNSIFNHGR